MEAEQESYKDSINDLQGVSTPPLKHHVPLCPDERQRGLQSYTDISRMTLIIAPFLLPFSHPPPP